MRYLCLQLKFLSKCYDNSCAQTFMSSTNEIILKTVNFGLCKKDPKIIEEWKIEEW